MKKNIHPKVYNTCYEDISTGKQFLYKSTIKSKNTLIIEGIEYEYIKCDITSSSHPIYTGKNKFVDTAGRIEKFKNKFKGLI